MSPENLLPLAVVPLVCDTLEFKAFNDDAWYSVSISLEGQKLRIKYLNFSDDHDSVFEASVFKSLKQLDDFRERFRSVSRQPQDNECRQLVKGVKVCACYTFSRDDVRFYDALVDDVSSLGWLIYVLEQKHSKDLCSCRYILSWLHGPNLGNLTTTSIDAICIVHPVLKLDPVVGSFLKVAMERLEPNSSSIIMKSKGVSQWQMVPYHDEGSNTPRKLGFYDRIQKAKRRAKRSFDPYSLQGSRHKRRMEESDLEGLKSQCMILIGNLDKQLCPSTISEFLRVHTSVSPQVIIFPSLSSEIYARGAIVLDSEEDFQMLCRFLNDPNLIITSSTGRPWVIMEKLVGLKRIKSSIGTLVPLSKNISQNGNRSLSNDFKVVCSGTPEFKIASDLRDLFLEFYNHQEQLYKKLALEETKILAV